MADPFPSYLASSKKHVDQDLRDHIGTFDTPFSDVASSKYLLRLEQAIQYSLLNGGKRIRPILVHAAAQAINSKNDFNSPQYDEGLGKIASSVEMLHSYSLIHDDLPAMDDDDLRRGQATCHIAFDEATAILAGDALQSRAFELLTEVKQSSAEIRLKLISILTGAAGQRGMVGGQAIDLDAVDKNISEEHLETLHSLKTGALIRAAVKMGATFARANPEQILSLDNYANAIGLAFQVQDDILDVEGNTQTLGKTKGVDQALNKPTYPSLLGLKGAKAKVQALHASAIASLISFGSSAQPLRDLSAFIVSRSH